MKLRLSQATTFVATAVRACIGSTAQAAEFRSADTHNADDYPTVAAVKYMSEQLDKKSRQAQDQGLQQAGARL